MRRLLLLASAMIFFDVAFFAAIAPLLPTYVDDLGLSKAQAGVLSASYAAGTLIAALPAGFVASRVGPRRSVICGLLLLGCSSLAFGLVDQIYLLDGARFAQGIAGALIWSGAMTWLITAAPDDKRGSVIGTALGTAVAGALLGPALGAVAATVGTGPVFGSVLIITAGLAYAASRLPEAQSPASQELGEVVATMVSRPVLVATAFVAVPSVMFGAVEVLVPLRIDALGGGHGVIAAGFIAGAGLEAVLAPIAGRFSDRVGRRTPYVTGLTICAMAMVGVALAATLGGVLAALITTSLGAGLCFAPALTQLSEVAESSSLHQGFAAGLSNMAWASGQVVGGIGGGVVASVTGNAIPSFTIAALLLVTVAYAFRTMSPGEAPPVGAKSTI
ncbi:MAG TPA: MFS transporter [Solirubrobacterales bacterium]|jgi:MFS family permease|nr:MFS transporter [Solirubrobacterales bacterium]